MGTTRPLGSYKTECYGLDSSGEYYVQRPYYAGDDFISLSSNQLQRASWWTFQLGMVYEAGGVFGSVYYEKLQT